MQLIGGDKFYERVKQCTERFMMLNRILSSKKCVRSKSVEPNLKLVDPNLKQQLDRAHRHNPADSKHICIKKLIAETQKVLVVKNK